MASKKANPQMAKAFKVTLTAIYKNDSDITPEAIADSLMKCVVEGSNGLMMLHVDSVVKKNDANKELTRLMVKLVEFKGDDVKDEKVE